MPPNFITTPESGNVNFVDGPKENGQGTATVSRGNPGLATVRSLTTLMAHVLIGIITGAAILFAFRNGTPLNATNQHLILCTIGYQFLMAEAILCLAPDSWLSSLGLKHKRWVHWVLQVLGSVLALAGCFVKIADKNLHWNSLHGRFALVSMVFTSVSLVNGLASMYAYEVRRFIPGILSRLSHICFGIVALGSASIALAYGFDKNSFRIWATTRLTDTLIIMVGAFTTIVIINPCITFYTKLSSSLRN